jgi:glycosyltransferase involved in cell wall biosynthesis
VRRAIESVAEQTFGDWEHIVVDDGSTDDSAAIVEACLHQNPRVKLIRKANGGVASARNCGYRASSPDSDYLLFLDADDCLEPRMLEVLVRYLETNAQVGVAFCDCRYVNEWDKEIYKPRLPRYVPSTLWVRELSPEEPVTPFVSIYCMAPVMESLSLIRRSAYEQSPGWDESFGQHCEGTNLFLHMVLRREIHFVPEVLYRYRQHSGQATLNGQAAIRQTSKLYRNWSNMSGLTSEQRALVAAARRFRARRLLPHCGWQEGVRLLRNGQIIRGFEYFGRAIWRHIRSFFFIYPYV